MVYQHAVITASLWYSCLVIALTFFFTFLLLPSSVSLSNPPSRTAKPPVTPSKCGRQTHTPHRKRRAASPHAFKRASVDSDVTALYLRNCPTVPIRKARCKWGLPGHRTQSRDLISFFFFSSSMPRYSSPPFLRTNDPRFSCPCCSPFVSIRTLKPDMPHNTLVRPQCWTSTFSLGSVVSF